MLDCVGSDRVAAPEVGERFLFPFGVSVFFPAFNDAPSLPDLLARTFEVLRSCVRDFEVIVVNDGSVDDTAEVLERLRQEYDPYLRVVTHPENRGYGAALRSGFANARKEFVFYTDGDGQYDPSELESLLRAAGDGVGLVNGYKSERQDPWHRVAIGWLYNQFARRLFHICLRDIDCDFRLIRKSVLDQCRLTSTSGTICVELVRRIEMSGAKVVELPVHHYPRLHGRSQFFRVRSLAATFFQLSALFFRLVVLPLVGGAVVAERNPAPAGAARRLPLRTTGLVLLAIVTLSFLAYARSLGLPFISDDYLQIVLGRRYGPVSGWPELMHDALYRCRATSLIVTYWTDRLFGADPFIFYLSSLSIHILNSLLVFALGAWRKIGWKVSAVAACYFAVSQRHHEAVIWYAALPELLVFLFVVLSFLCWVRWLQSEGRNPAAYWCAFACFLVALLSKESGVVVPPLMLFAGLLERRNWRTLAIRVLPFALVAVGYFGLIYAARDTHLHFNDAGTFSLKAPFLWVLFRSTVTLVRYWGSAALIALFLWKPRGWKRILSIGGVWLVITFLPYCFLTYMPYVPSRHTYLASVGLALVVGAAFLECYARTSPRHGRKAIAAIAGLLVVHQCSYLWIKKQAQFELRAKPTEDLLKVARATKSPIYITCFQYPPVVVNLALEVSGPPSGAPPVVFGPPPAKNRAGLNLCTDVPKPRPSTP